MSDAGKCVREAMDCFERAQAAEERAARRAGPTAAEKRILTVLAEGGRIEQCHLADAILFAPSGEQKRTVSDATFYALTDQGWLWMVQRGIWHITTAGRAALAKAEAAC